MKFEFLTPVGRLVQGSPLEPQTKNMQGQPLMTKSGQPTQRFFCAVAFKKTDPAFAALYGLMVQAARASFPHLFNAQGACTHPKFSWKIVDGDGVDDNGRPNAQKEGFAGNYVVRFQSSFAPRCFYAGKYQPHEAILDPKALPRGYYVRVAGTIEGNDDVNKPGLYVNLGMLELVGGQPSDIIQSGPDAGAVFGGQAAQLPAGVAPVAMSAPAMPGMAMPAPAMPGMTMPGAMPGAAPFAAPAVAPSLPTLPSINAGMPSAGPATASPSSPALPVAPNPAILAGPPAAPAAPAVPTMTAKAGGLTYAQFVASGWTEAAMRAEGYIV